MTPAPFFTIIIPAYNSEECIQNCINSIRRQTYTGYEILVIDGLSTDKTMEIVEKNAVNFKNLLYLSEKDRGIYDAMNKGIEKAKGNWLYFLGSDDLLFNENVLEEVFNVLSEHDVDVGYGNVQLGASKEIYAGEFTNEKIYEINISHQAIFFKKSIFELTGKFDLQYRTNADWDHNFRWFFHDGVKKKYFDIVVAVYAESGASSFYKDEVFRSRKEELYLDHAKGLISRKQKAGLFKVIAAKKRSAGNNLSFIWYAFKYFLYKIPL